MSNDLTTEAFWNDYWSTLKLPISVDLNFKNDRVIAEEILKAIPANRPLTAIEIGCAPGKWLSFLAKELHCQVTGIEYLKPAAEKTIENLKIQNITNYNVIAGDFFNHQIKETFDVVVSLGFIEHFDNYDKVLEDQLKLVSKGGYLVMGIPRFIGINYYLQKCIDFFIKNKLIPGHNLKTMNLQNFEKFAKEHNLTIICNKFVGGFEPGLFPVAEVRNFPARVSIKIVMRVFNWLFGKVNSSMTSSYQVAIFKK